jgi:N6-adenosine-specific RNA methylase IME4
MQYIKTHKKGEYTFYELWEDGKYVKNVKEDTANEIRQNIIAGKELSKMLKTRPELVSTMGNAPMRAMSANRNANLKKVTNPIPIADIYYADPPWKYDFSETVTREIENQYPTMELEDICNIKNIMPTPDSCVLFLWATAPKLLEALKVMTEWGFSYKTNAVWDKEKIGMGYWFRGQHELLLVGTKGQFSPPVQETRQSSVIKEARTEHSRKPLAIHDRIESMFPESRYTEIFARSKYNDKWQVWGNES